MHPRILYTHAGTQDFSSRTAAAQADTCSTYCDRGTRQIGLSAHRDINKRQFSV
jgi:hypothetical protein